MDVVHAVVGLDGEVHISDPEQIDHATGLVLVLDAVLVEGVLDNVHVGVHNTEGGGVVVLAEEVLKEVPLQGAIDDVLTDDRLNWDLLESSGLGLDVLDERLDEDCLGVVLVKEVLRKLSQPNSTST